MPKTENDLPETIRRIEEASSSWKKELRDELMTFRDYLGNADKSCERRDKKYFYFLMDLIYYITNNQLKEETNV